MKKECNHAWYASAKIMRKCSRCNKEVKVLPMRNYSLEEFKKLYPSLSRPSGKVIFDTEPKD